MKIWDIVKKCRPGDTDFGLVYIGRRNPKRFLGTVGKNSIDLTELECRGWHEWYIDKDNPVMGKTLAGITAYENNIVIVYK